MTTHFTGLCLLLLGLALLYFIQYLCARGPIHIDSRWMHVSSVDENGDQIGRSRWVRIPKPDRIETNGLNHVVKYVARLAKSQSGRAYLIIASTDGNKACLILREDGALKILEHVHLAPSSRVVRKSSWRFPDPPPHPPEPEKEQAIRDLFAELNIAPDRDDVHEYNGYADAMRDLQYPIGNEIAPATLIIQRLLREVYHIQDSDGLEFVFKE